MKILQNFSWIFFANILVALSKWLIIIIIAKLLNPTEVGIYSLAFALTAPIVLFSNMKLRSLFVSSDNSDIDNYILIRKILSVITMGIMVLLGIIFYENYLYIIVLVGLSKILDLHSEMYYAIPHKVNNLIIVGKLMLIKQIILLFAFSIVLLSTQSLLISLFVQNVFQFIYLIFIEKRYILKKYNFFIKSNKRHLKQIFWLGLPLGIVQMLNSFNTNYPRYVLEYVESATVLGYFSAILYIAIVIQLFTNAISQVYLPVLSMNIKKRNFLTFKKNVFVYLTAISILLGLTFILGVSIYGEKILFVIYGPTYAEYNYLLIAVAIYSSINLINANFDTALISMNYIKILPKITLFTFVVTLFAGYYLVNLYSLIGAAVTLILSAIIQLVLKYFYTNKKVKELIDSKGDN